ncbi:MAG: hypothetical protein HOK30_23945 [Rhodospirillaceae bacterium]|jgi:hypothetical protein|nr:hypothetical protein [Rhodospirillaceae bacterium]MBT5191879.1 hypothetical protein [Rhodospirillaceae bacterium]MBT6430741.1 hypothetical protein [Rhodospirillaceae bacterium]MBT7664002.1 hypothetical protein [Rhodospirillaceae bacterium]MBT7757242.1 hypothetical protein [Rhodospirillaceae bacterium]
MSAKSVEITIKLDLQADGSVVTSDTKFRGRRATERADADWRDACGDEAVPTLSDLGILDTAGDWHDRFLIRFDDQRPNAVVIACGDTVRDDWDIDRLGDTLAVSLPDGLQELFAEGCRQSLEEGGPVPVEGSYQHPELREVLFRCIMMPVQGINEGGNFVCGAYSHKIAA